MASLSRQLAQWIVGLRYEDLPPEVVDRAKGVTLQALISMLIGSQTPGGRSAIELVVEEELGVAHGATIMVDGRKVTRGGAAFANSEMCYSGGKWDTFRMLTHPGTSILPAALAAAESTPTSGKAFITAVAAAYEVMERLAADFIPTVMARGFHASPVFGIFGAAIAAAKIMKLDDEQMNSTIALAASLASGSLEGARSGGKALREGAAVRNAILAAALAKKGHAGGETVLEGDAGFYHAYTGNKHGELSYSFVGATKASLDSVTANLGKEWICLETLYRIYSTAGYNIAHVDVTAKLCEENDIRPENIERIEAVVNWLETQYPSPAYPSKREDIGTPRPAGTAYHTAFGAVARAYPLTRGIGANPTGPDTPPAVLDLMKRVTLIPSHTMTLFGPRITIFTKDGKSYTKQGTGREFIWDFDGLVQRMKGVAPALPVPESQFESLIAACRELDKRDSAKALIEPMVKR
jgi:2-methylcitrate dehydratase PrpD